MLGVALLGCGRIAVRHSELLGNNEIKGAKLVCVCDIDATRAKALGEKFGIPHFSSLEAMMEGCGDKIDIVSILTPSGMHAK
ncbi:MAG: Gfo/Idh/MocA family oxidoreductase, partial [Helicobacter sp.]|nr:Gfo/Idh/MocA family oxidoreductase [Helicobacter sp.]